MNDPRKKSVMPKSNFFDRYRSQQERAKVVSYLQQIEVEGMRKHLCFGGSSSILYDKNYKTYKISRTATLEEAKAIVDEIKKVNL